MLSKKYCPICGEEIVFDYTVPTKSFRIDENGAIIRDDNNETDAPRFRFYCGNDSEDDIGITKDLLDWEITVEEQFRKTGAYAL